MRIMVFSWRLGENIDFIEDIRDGDMKARGMTG
jgi:hypothetical protein